MPVCTRVRCINRETSGTTAVHISASVSMKQEASTSVLIGKSQLRCLCIYRGDDSVSFSVSFLPLFLNGGQLLKGKNLLLLEQILFFLRVEPSWE